MKLKIVIAVAGLLVAVGALTTYVGIRVGLELAAARSVLSGSATELTAAEIRSAREHLLEADRRLNDVPAGILGFVPVVAQNISALDATVEATLPTLDSALELRSILDEIEATRLVQDGAVRLDLIERLAEPLQRQVATLEKLESEIADHRDGWLAPPLWDSLDELLTKIEEVRSGAEKTSGLLDVAPAMLGEEEPRRYLVLLINNAELRGAGGLASGVGTIRVDRGRISLGRFYRVTELRDRRPYHRVPAPPDFERRFARYEADRTWWINVTFSVDIPEVAEVAARLFAFKPGLQTDGVLVADPRGIAALMPPDARVEVPDVATTLTRDQLAEFTYSTAYRRFGVQAERRDTLLALGQAAFQTVLESGFGDRPGLVTAGRAIAAGHLRFVSFNEDEQAAIDLAEASGDLGPQPSDSLLVAAQNNGGDKLDYWIRRTVGHTCNIADDGSARCITRVESRNVAPLGLPRYVANQPYALAKGFLEVYIPERATLRTAAIDGEPTTYSPEPEDERTSIGVFTEVPREDRQIVTVAYDLPAPTDPGYSLVITPQPLAHDAEVNIDLLLPDDWTVDGPAEMDDDGRLSYSGPLNETIRIDARPNERTGISAVWEGLSRFWTEPVF